MSSWGCGRDELATVDKLAARILVSHQRHESGDRLPAVRDEDDLSSFRFGHLFTGVLPWGFHLFISWLGGAVWAMAAGKVARPPKNQFLGPCRSRQRPQGP